MPNIQINKAYYGSSAVLATDVTSTIQQIAASAISANSKTVDIQVNSSVLGVTNPDPSVPMSLSVIYQFGNLQTAVQLVGSGKDGTTLILQTVSSRFVVHKAIYSGGTTFGDITQKFNEAILESTDNLIFTVGSTPFLNRFFDGFDIAFGVHKVLYLEYDAGGGTIDYACATDGQEVNLNTL